MRDEMFIAQTCVGNGPESRLLDMSRYRNKVN